MIVIREGKQLAAAQSLIESYWSMRPPLRPQTTRRPSPVVTKSLYGVARTVVVSTRKHDIHRRYIAHVLYALNNRGIDHTFLKGRYLNQELVNKGFAKVV